MISYISLKSIYIYIYQWYDINDMISLILVISMIDLRMTIVYCSQERPETWRTWRHFRFHSIHGHFPHLDMEPESLWLEMIQKKHQWLGEFRSGMASIDCWKRWWKPLKSWYLNKTCMGYFVWIVQVVISKISLHEMKSWKLFLGLSLFTLCQHQESK